jgi:intergrase/recombinase
MDSETLITLALGGGGATLIGGLFQAWRNLRNDAAKTARDSIGDLERWRDDADEARRRAEESLEKAYRLLARYRRYAGALEYELLSHGLKPPSDIARPEE